MIFRRTLVRELTATAIGLFVVLALVASCTTFQVSGVQVNRQTPSFQNIGQFEVTVAVNEFLGSSGGANLANITATSMENAIFDAIRRGSGGAGRWRGGDGICRQILALTDAQLTLLSERRRFPPYGLSGGEAGQTGENSLVRQGEVIPLPSKGTFEILAGDIVCISTPGGGGFGQKTDG